MLTEKRLCKIIYRLNLIINKLLSWGWYDSSIAYAKCLANLYYMFGVKYVDIMLERYVKTLSDKIVLSPSSNKDEYVCVFYDDFSVDSRGLTLQYVESLIALGYKITYIYPAKSKDNKRIISALCHSHNKIISIEQNHSGMRLAQQIYDIVSRSGAKHLFLHMLPYSIEASIALCALDSDIKKYNINLTDHAFNIGTTHMDYNMEFRNYGAHISVKYRGIEEGKEVLLPMFPILDTSHPHEGYLQAFEDKVVVLTGGAIYKVIDDSEIFFKLVKKILLTNLNVVFVYVGCRDIELFDKYLIKYGLKDRMLVLGERKDLCSLMMSSDIYMNTFPIGGGLMCQMAASLGKPVINYKHNQGIEECICQRQHIEMSFDTVTEFCNEMTRLIEDEKYRCQRGQDFRNSVIDASNFRKLLGELLKKGNGGVPIDLSKRYEKESIVDMSSAIIRENQNMIFHKFMCKTLRYKVIVFPNILRRVWKSQIHHR